MGLTDPGFNYARSSKNRDFIKAHSILRLAIGQFLSPLFFSLKGGVS